MLFVVRHTKIRSKLQILKRISDVRDTPHQGWQSRLPVATHTSVCIPRMLVTALRNLTIANYLAPLKDLELSRKAARANAADMQARLAGSRPRTRHSSAQAPQSHSKTQMQLTVPLLPCLLGPLNAMEKSSQHFNVALHGWVHRSRKRPLMSLSSCNCS